MGTDESTELLRLSRLAARSGEAAARDAGVQLLAVNRPGYGRSDPHESDHRTVTDDTVAVADQLGIARFAALGMSVGGPYALACAARHPGRVSSVGVVAAPAVLPELDPPRHRDDLAPEQRALFTRLSGGTVAEGVRDALASTSGYLRDAAVTFRRWQFRPEQVSRPTWLWYGELDPNASVRNGRWLAERTPDATLVVRAGTAHLAALLRYWDEILTTLRPVG